MPKRKPAKRSGKVPREPDDLFIIGLDAEWQRVENRNELLSFQVHILYRGKSYEGIDFPMNGKRPKFARLIGAILECSKKAGIFQTYPKSLTLVSHYCLAELSMMEDFPKLISRLDTIRGTFATIAEPIPVQITDTSRNQHRLMVTLRDTLLLTPGGDKTLEALGRLHGTKKVELPKGAIERMRALLEEDPELFSRYALVDAQIAALHAREMASLNLELTGRCEVPVTLGSLAVGLAHRKWSELGIDPKQVLGQETVLDEEFNPTTGRLRRKTKTASQIAVFEQSPLANEAFHGGYNSSHWHGPTERGQWDDVDFKGAYPTALSSLGMPRWDQLKVTTDLTDFGLDSIGLARVKFRFPKHVSFPCLPVRVPNGLIFPLSGESYATTAELIVASRLGAIIEIHHGVVIPMDHDIHPFEEVMRECSDLRETYKARGDTIRERLYKELGLSIYGKLAQGLNQKRVYDSRSNAYKPIPPSKLTQPYLAAYTTGLIRAALAEVMNALHERTIVSATTDGFIVEGPFDDELEETATGGPICELLKTTRQRLSGDRTILEVKHQVAQVVSARTRGQITAISKDDSPPILAKAGVKTPRHLVDRHAQNQWMLEQFLTRTSDTTFTFEALRPLVDLVRKGGDLISVMQTRPLNLDFDFRRKPASSWTKPVGERAVHLSFTTEPFADVEEYHFYRDCWAAFRKLSGPLKTEEDFARFDEFVLAAPLRQQGLNLPQEGIERVVMTQFIRALVREEWGLEGVRRRFTYPELAKVLSTTGVTVTVDALKNGRRGKLVPHSIPQNPKILKLVDQLRCLFPTFNSHEMLDPLPIEAIESRSRHQNCTGPAGKNTEAGRAKQSGRGSVGD